MDKVLAFSILSASPADISAGAGFDGSWARLSWQRGAAAPRQQQREEQDEDKEKRGSRSRSGDGREHVRRGGGGRAAGPPAASPRFALELDGIECFETIVSH